MPATKYFFRRNCVVHLLLISFSFSVIIDFGRAEQLSSLTKKRTAQTTMTTTTTTVTTETRQQCTSTVMSSEDITSTKNTNDDDAFIIEGIEISKTKEVSTSLILSSNDSDDDETIVLHHNGEGIRNINIFGFDYKVYVASFYSLHGNLQSMEDVMNDEDAPKRFDFVFVRSFDKGKVQMAWTRQLDASITEYYTSYSEYKKDRAMFISFFGEITLGGTETVILLKDETIVIDGGIYKGSIKGKNFQRAFLNMWFGQRPVTEGLKTGFLTGRRKHEEEECNDVSSSSTINNVGKKSILA